MLHADQVRAYRAMTPEQKLRAAAGLHQAARQLLEAGVRARHAEWTDAQVAEEAKRLLLHARD